MLANIESPRNRPFVREQRYESFKASAIEAELMQRLDDIHALSANGLAPHDTLSNYLAFLDTMPQGMRLCAKAIVAVALIDNVFAMDELKLEQRGLRCSLDARESAMYELLVRIGRKHGQMIGRSDA